MTSTPPALKSPSSSQGSFHEPNLEELVEYLLASKRSLNSISLIWRAREIVDSGRQALEENALLCAQNTFVKSTLDKEIDVLEAIRYGATIVDAEGDEQFQTTLSSLDTSSARLQKTLALLRSTPVEVGFRPENEEPKFLFDFIDEGAIGHLEKAIKGSIDRYDVARKQLAETCEAFEQDLERLHTSTSPDQIQGDVHLQEGETPVPALFYQLESKATEAAGHLEGLVKHYDLCVTALKHTEGGGDAITQASIGEDQQTSALVGLGVDLDKLEAAPAKAISDEERRELFSVLVKDADEVDEVVADIKDSVAEMEDSMSQISAHIDTLRETSGGLREATIYLKDMTSKLPIYISACAEFQRSWDDERELLVQKLDELESLREFYAGFSDAYDELILEVHRRRQVRRDMEKVIRNAMQQLEGIYDDDAVKRDSFRENQAEFIPSDLWPGLVNAPSRFRIVRDEDDDGEDMVPSIAKEVVERSLKRVKERAKPFKRPA